MNLPTSNLKMASLDRYVTLLLFVLEHPVYKQIFKVKVEVFNSPSQSIERQ